MLDAGTHPGLLADAEFEWSRKKVCGRKRLHSTGHWDPETILGEQLATTGGTYRSAFAAVPE